MVALNHAKISKALGKHKTTINRLKRQPASLVALGNLTKAQFDAEMQVGMNGMASGRIISADDVESEMKKFCA